jgi:hypothetical protein
MAWAGGTFTRANGANEWVTDFNNGVGIEPARHDTQDNDLATGVNQCLNKDGSNAATGNLNLGGFRYTNGAAATARTDLAQVGQVQDGDYVWLGTTGGTATAQTATATPAVTVYKAGQKFRMKIGASLGSTGSTNTVHTLNINGIGAKNLVNQDGTNPTLGTWVAGAILEVCYDGTNLVIINDAGGILSYTPTVTGGGSMTISSLVIDDARFIKNGKAITAWISVQFTTGGTASTTVNISMPVNSTGYNFTQVFPTLNFDGTTVVGYLQLSAPPSFVVSRDLVVNNWALAAGRYARFVITYTAV